MQHHCLCISLAEILELRSCIDYKSWTSNSDNSYKRILGSGYIWVGIHHYSPLWLVQKSENHKADKQYECLTPVFKLGIAFSPMEYADVDEVTSKLHRF